MPRCSDHRVVSLYWCQLLGWARWLLSDSPGTMPSRFCLLAVCLSIHARKKRKYIKNLTIGTSFNLDLTCQFRRGYFLNSFVSLNLNPQLKNCVNDPLQRSKLDTLIRNPQTLHRLVFILGGVHITLLVSNHMFYLSVVSPIGALSLSPYQHYLLVNAAGSFVVSSSSGSKVQIPSHPWLPRRGAAYGRRRAAEHCTPVARGSGPPELCTPVARHGGHAARTQWPASSTHAWPTAISSVSYRNQTGRVHTSPSSSGK